MNVVMLHSVGNTSYPWYQKWLSVSLNHFESFCRFLQKKNYQSLFLEDWYNLQNNTDLLNEKQVVLTFDDGYLDNWVFAYPILKKYGLKGTIFINPEFVDPSDSIRPNLENVWNGEINEDSLIRMGFLNWKEIKLLDSSGVFDIQSHSMSHNYYFQSEKLIDFYEGQDEYHWLAWNEKPERKPFWITENQNHLVTTGYPIFEYGRALGLKRFIPSDEFIQFIISKYNTYTSSDLHNIKARLFADAQNFKSKSDIGRYETDDEQQERYSYELFDSKRILEENMNKKVDYLCWPGGGYNELSIDISIQAGYKASTIGSRESTSKLDNTGVYKRIPRFGLGSFYKMDNQLKEYSDKNHLVYSFMSHSGNKNYKNLLRAKKYFNILKYKLGI